VKPIKTSVWSDAGKDLTAQIEKALVEIQKSGPHDRRVVVRNASTSFGYTLIPMVLIVEIRRWFPFAMFGKTLVAFGFIGQTEVVRAIIHDVSFLPPQDLQRLILDPFTEKTGFQAYIDV
jgi:hypothetical protein